MSGQKRQNSYTLADIERYLQGRLLPAEMHALEKAALQDPFLADALEGYRSADLVAAKDDLADIRERLLSRDRDKDITPQIIPLRSSAKWWRIAAIFLLVSGAGSVGLYLFNNNTTRDTEIVHQPATAVKPGPTAPQLSDQQSKQEPLASNIPKPVGRAAPAVRPPANVPRQETPAAEIASKTLAQGEPITLKDSGAMLAKLEAAAPQKISHEDARKPDFSQALSGRVSGVQVNAGNSTGRETRAGGQPGASTDTSSQALEEVVVTGYKAQRKKDMGKSAQLTKPAATRDISPENGWQSFINYLSEKISAVRSRSAGGIFAGTIEVELDLDRRGKVKQVTILKTFNPALDEIIIQAIKEGPVWLSANGKPAQGKFKAAITL